MDKVISSYEFVFLLGNLTTSYRGYILGVTKRNGLRYGDEQAIGNNTQNYCNNNNNNGQKTY